MAGILVSFWDGLFSGAMLVVGRVTKKIRQNHPLSSVGLIFVSNKSIFNCNCGKIDVWHFGLPHPNDSMYGIFIYLHLPNVGTYINSNIPYMDGMGQMFGSSK